MAEYWVGSKNPNSNATQYLYVTSNPNSSGVIAGPYATLLEARAAELQIGKSGTTGILGVIGDLPGAVSAGANAEPGVASPLAGLSDIGDFFHRLTESSTWIRVGEVLLGVILLYAGVRAVTASSGARQPAAKPVKQAASKAASVAAPEARLATRTVAKKVAPKTTARVASHRAAVRKYGAKQPYTGPKETHIYHHKAKS